MARLDRVGNKSHDDSFDLQAGLIGGQRSDYRAVEDISGEIQGKRQGIDEEQMAKAYQEAAAGVLSYFARPEDKMQTAKDLSNSEEVAEGAMQRVNDMFTPKSQRDRNRRISDEARLREETRQAITPPPEEPEEDDGWEQVAEIDDSDAWGSAGLPQMTAGDYHDRQDALDEIQEEQWTD
jgi:hypothetical protein